MTNCYTAPVIKVEKPNAAEALIDLDVSADNPYFKGHFPDWPILPGVTQIAWVVEQAQAVLGLAEPLANMPQLKFQTPVFPDQAIQLALQFDANKSALNFRYFQDELTLSSGKLAYPLQS